MLPIGSVIVVLPSHTPVQPGFGEQTPAWPITLHASHARVQTASQQMPSMQCPVSHALSEAHVSPSTWYSQVAVALPDGISPL